MAAAKIPITPSIELDESELEERFVRSSGPGGQNVNKVATAVQLRWNARRSQALPEAVRDRLLRLAGSRLTEEGVIVIEARRFRTRERNRQDARERLVRLIERAAELPRVRRPTRPSRSAKAGRLAEKRRRGQVKRERRRRPPGEDD